MPYVCPYLPSHGNFGIRDFFDEKCTKAIHKSAWEEMFGVFVYYGRFARSGIGKSFAFASSLLFKA